MELSFLSKSSVKAADAFSQVVRAIISRQQSPVVAELTPVQIEKIRSTIKFVASRPQEERASILEGVKCPDAASVASVIDSYQSILKTNEPIHVLRDFDWSVSLVLGTSRVSNVKESICTFRFDVDESQNGIVSPKSHNVELTLTEAQDLLAQLENARNAQRDVMK